MLVSIMKRNFTSARETSIKKKKRRQNPGLLAADPEYGKMQNAEEKKGNASFHDTEYRSRLLKHVGNTRIEPTFTN